MIQDRHLPSPLPYLRPALQKIHHDLRGRGYTPRCQIRPILAPITRACQAKPIAGIIVELDKAAELEPAK